MFSSAKTQIPTALQALINKQISVFQILYNIKVLKICILLFIIFNAKLEAFKCQYTHPRVGIASFPLLLNYFRAICDTDFFFPSATSQSLCITVEQLDSNTLKQITQC